MSSSECYWCVDSKPAYGNLMGTKGDPFACCHRCNVFCCGHHGQRDNGAQKFFCFDCDKSILIASAIAAANLNDIQKAKVLSATQRIKASDISSPDNYSSFEEFIRRNPGYADVLQDVDESKIDYTTWTDPILKDIFKKFPPVAQKMLVAAAIMIADTDDLAELETLGDTLFINLKTSVKIPVRHD